MFDRAESAPRVQFQARRVAARDSRDESRWFEWAHNCRRKADLACQGVDRYTGPAFPGERWVVESFVEASRWACLLPRNATAARVS